MPASLAWFQVLPTVRGPWSVRIWRRRPEMATASSLGTLGLIRRTSTARFLEKCRRTTSHAVSPNPPPPLPRRNCMLPPPPPPRSPGRVAR
uniref:Uncharacterized protein n=1 Tax=Arundo donax TaxID=35708 RepID=A0A0A9GRK6_ARUDO